MGICSAVGFFFFSSRRRHTRWPRDWSSDVCSSDLEAGDQAYCALSWAEEQVVPRDVEDANARVDATVRYWRRWLGRARLPDHRWRDPIQRSALTVKGLTYMPT